MFKNRILDIKQKALKRYVGTFCEASNDNDAVKKLRELIKLDDSWESSYKIEDFSNNVIVTFTNGSDFVEVKFLSTAGNAVNYTILVNDKRVVSRNDTDDVQNVLNFILKDSIFRSDLTKINGSFLKNDENNKSDI